MTYPSLVRIAKTPCHITLYATEMNEYGERVTVLDANLYCNWQAASKRVVTADKQEIQTTGTALFVGDIASDITTGTVTVFGKPHNIAVARKHRNPDGTVNYTSLEVV